jgi:Putative peptidoglycan binding domain
MQSGRFILFAALVLATATPSFAFPHARRGPTSPSSPRRHASARSASKPSGPRAIDSDRATQIQAALIKSGYLTGIPSGHWDAASEAAMQKLQGDNGWQTKLTPDSRALIKLGLGPKQDVAETTALPSVASQPTGGQLLPNSSSSLAAQP